MNLPEDPPNPDMDPEACRRVREIIGESGVRQALSPIDRISGLPGPAYHSPGWMKLEQERIFARHWVFAATDGELPEAGSIKPLDVGGMPIIMVRGTDGDVRAFHNVCRHRGTLLVAESCSRPLITCPYHAWSYRLDGTIRSRPHFQGADETDTFGDGGDDRLNLLRIRSDSWNGCHFVNLSGNAQVLTDWLAPIFGRTGAYDFSRIRWIGKKCYTVQSNWKLVLENYMEGYHVFAAHPRLLEHAPMSVRWQGEWTEQVFYNDYVASGLTPGRGGALPHYPGLSDVDRRRGMWFAAFPNFYVEVYADQFVVLGTFPVASDKTLEELHFFVVGDEARNQERYAAAREELVTMWDELNLEDVALLERLQQGRRSAAFAGSNMSPAWEGPSHKLSQKVIEAICRN